MFKKYLLHIIFKSSQPFGQDKTDPFLCTWLGFGFEPEMGGGGRGKGGEGKTEM